MTGKDAEDCPLKLLQNKEASKVDASPEGTSSPEVSEEATEGDASPEVTTVAEVSPVSPPDVNQGGEEPTFDEESSDDDVSMEADVEEVSEALSIHKTENRKSYIVLQCHPRVIPK